MRRSVAGICVFASIVLGGLDTFWMPIPEPLIGLPQWLAGALLWPDVTPGPRRQALCLVAIGCTSLAIGASRGGAFHWTEVFGGNAMLIAMLAGVSFLQLIRVAGRAGDTRPTGRRAICSNIAGLHLLGAVANMPTVFIMASGMAPDGRPDHRQFRLLLRGFSAAGFWSPFFVGMPAALTFAPGAHVGTLILVGLPLALIGLVLTTVELSREDPATFRGYPLGYRSLLLPVLMALTVLTLHVLRPTYSMLGIIMTCAPLLAAAALLASRGRSTGEFARHSVLGLARMGNELSLFLGAGVMAGGLESVIGTVSQWQPFDSFGGPQASALLAVLVAFAMLGVHPLITIAAASALLHPIDPNATLLALSFLATWAIAMTASPFSGLNLAIQGVYGIRGRDILRWNLRYSLVMLGAAGLALNLYTWLWSGS